MTKLHYVVGDATSPQGAGKRIIVHICNDIGAWGAGFVLAISRRWTAPEESYRRWHATGGEPPFEPGRVQFVEVDPSLWVANMIAQRGIRRSGRLPPIRYDAVRTCLEQVAEFARENSASVHMPRIGCGLAGGSWDQMEPIILETLIALGVETTVYDLG
jgi:O-acetyl-ADP-ribose deacetylase (regulator of RNase III)